MILQVHCSKERVILLFWLAHVLYLGSSSIARSISKDVDLVSENNHLLYTQSCCTSYIAKSACISWSFRGRELHRWKRLPGKEWHKYKEA